MEITGLQIIVTVVLIVSAAGLALLCDFLKAKNEQLRDAMAELRVRRAEDAARPAIKVERKPVDAAPAPASDAARVSQPIAQGSPTALAENLSAPATARQAANNHRPAGRSYSRNHDAAGAIVRKSNPAPKIQRPQNDPAVVPPLNGAAELASLTGRQPLPQPAEPKSAPKMDDINSREALADWLNRRAAARAVRVAQATEPAALSSAAEKTAPPTPVTKPVEFELKDEPASMPAPNEALAATAPVISVEIDAALWESLISGKPAGAAPAATIQPPEPSSVAAPETHLELIHGAAASSSELVVPGGMFEHSFLARLLEIHKPFTGLVVSIGVSENDGRAPQNEDLMRSASSCIAGLLREGDFGCQSGDDEFLVICPNEQGAEAQRRLSHISERLWDYQLRGFGAFSILFSWGGIDVRNEPLSDAVASATERMYQTKRCRKTVSMDSANQHRKAV